MQIKDFQKLIRDRYHETDARRGVPGTFLWLTEELGELASELADRERGQGDPEALALEVADVLAWLATIANVCEVDLEDAVHRKYVMDGGPPGTK
ncbi:MAG: MazG nucleotide pyrophosphohydrolase domain-containing protein [Planctomycetota bacterium]|nr:MazG nucleotide pyrophosphohydrolase domain-containing protein [Planctomycetota bacterium]